MSRIIDLKKLRDEQPEKIAISDRPQITTRPNDAGRSKDHQFFQKRQSPEESLTSPVADETPSAGKSTEAPPQQLPGSIEWKTVAEPNIRSIRDRVIVISIIAAGFIIGGLLTQNYLFAILALLVAITLIMLSVREPKEIAFAITARGVRIDDRIYEYDNLKSFWIFYDPPHHKELSVESKKVFMPYIKLPLESTDPVQMRRFLKTFIPERKHTDSIADIVWSKLGF